MSRKGSDGQIHRAETEPKRKNAWTKGHGMKMDREWEYAE